MYGFTMTSTFENLYLNRYNQLSSLSEVTLGGSPIVIHGSLAHAALTGCQFPAEVKRVSNEQRDIDVYIPANLGKVAAESALLALGLSEPAPVDAGLCDLLIKERDCLWASKDGVQVEVKDPEDIFSQTVLHATKFADGLALRSLTASGLLGVHLLEPSSRYDLHWFQDRRFELWCKNNGVTVPSSTMNSIEEFHVAYRSRYPFGGMLKHASRMYVSVLPEGLRAKFRARTHDFMRRHAGRL